MKSTAIEDLRPIDADAREVNCPVLVIGNRAVRMVENIVGATGEGGPVSLVEPDDPAFVYCCLQLGEVRGWTPQLHLYGFPTDDPRVEHSFWNHLQNSRWLVIASDGPKIDPSWPKLFEKLTRVIDAQRRDIVVAFVGSEWLAPAWAAYGGPEPLAVGPGWQSVLKPIAKDFLATLPLP